MQLGDVCAQANIRDGIQRQMLRVETLRDVVCSYRYVTKTLCNADKATPESFSNGCIHCELRGSRRAHEPERNESFRISAY